MKRVLDLNMPEHLAELLWIWYLNKSYCVMRMTPGNKAFFAMLCYFTAVSHWFTKWGAGVKWQCLELVFTSNPWWDIMVCCLLGSADYPTLRNALYYINLPACFKYLRLVTLLSSAPVAQGSYPNLRAQSQIMLLVRGMKRGSCALKDWHWRKGEVRVCVCALLPLHSV